MKKHFKIHLLSIFSIILLCIGVTIKELQNDTFYMIKLGEFIQNHGIDLLDHWSWISNLSYTYPHWLYDVFIFNIYYFFRFDGVYVSTILLFIILIFCIYFVQLKVNKNWFLAYFISILSIACLYGFATARAQLITIILLFLEVYFIEKLNSTGQKRYIALLMFFSWLIANLHATIWLFYFILYLPFLGEHIGYQLKSKTIFKNNKTGKILLQKISFFKEFLISFGLSFLMGIFTPSKICYTYIFKVMMGDSQNFISEHASIVPIQHPCFLVFILILLMILIFSSTKIKLSELLMLCGLILMCLFSVRHLVFFYTIGLFYLSRLCIRYLDCKNDYSLKIIGDFIISNKFVYCVLFLIIGILSLNQFQKNQKLDYVNEEMYPVQASSFIKENLDVSTIHLYNDYNYGSYLMFQDIPVFIDSRCDLYLSEFNGLNYSIFDDDMKMESNYQDKFQFYDITHVLILRDSIFYQILNVRKEYPILYEDENFVLVERIVS